MSDTSIRIGLPSFDVDAVIAALGAVSGGSAGDGGGGTVRDSGEAAVEYVNSLGGIAGRQVEPVWFEYQAANYVQGSARQRETQRMCAHFTEDQPVFAFSTTGAAEEILLDCAARSGTVLVETHSHHYPSSERFREIAPFYYSPHGWIAERRERAVGRFLAQHGFFDRDAVVGLMIEDRPGIRQGIETGLKPALAEVGIRPDVEIVYPDWIESPWESYVLRLRSEGVTHVVFSGTQGGLATVGMLMLRAAESQRYRPKWGFASDHRPGLMETYGTPAAQLENVSAMGWQAYPDVNAPIGVDEPQSPSAERCAEHIRQRGVTGATAYVGQIFCETMLFVRAALEHADVVSPRAMAAGVERLADTYVSTVTLGGATRFGPGRHDGLAAVRRVGFNRECGCFEYTTAPQPVPE